MVWYAVWYQTAKTLFGLQSQGITTGENHQYDYMHLSTSIRFYEHLLFVSLDDYLDVMCNL